MELLPKDYNYEYEILKQNKLLQEFEVQNGNENKKIYVEKTIEAGNTSEISIYPYRKRIPSSSYRHVGNPSSPKQKKYNLKKSKKYLLQLINTNFNEKDYFLTLTYSEAYYPGNVEESKNYVRNYFKRLNSYLSRRKMPNVRYIYFTERGGYENRIHHHVIIGGELNRRILIDKWKYGYASAFNLWRDKDFERLMNYLTKAPEGNKLYERSHNNLREPMITYELCNLTKEQVYRIASNTNLLEEEMQKRTNAQLIESNSFISDFGECFINAKYLTIDCNPEKGGI